MIKPIILSTLLLPNHSFANDDLFQQVFGAKRKSTIVEIPLFIEGVYILDVKVTIKSDKLINIHSKSLKTALEQIVKESTLSKITKAKISTRDLKDIGINVNFLPEDFKIVAQVKNEIKKSRDWNFDESTPKWAVSSIRPNDHTFILNYNLKKEIIHNKEQDSFFRSDLNPSYSYKAFNLEGNFFYDSSFEKEGLLRSDTVLSWRDPKRMQTVELGDLNYNVSNYQGYRSLLGLSWSSDFSLNPYKETTPQYSQKIYLDERSQVKIYVNGRLIKVDFFPAGEHALNNLPLNNGLNNIRVEVIGQSGRTKFFNFTKSSSSELLAADVESFSYALGISSDENSEDKQYDFEEGATLSLNYQKGFSDEFTYKGYAQGDKEQLLLGSEFISTWSIGVISADLALSSIFDKENGAAIKLNYDISDFNDTDLGNYRVAFGVEWQSENFASLGTLSPNNSKEYDFTLAVTKSLPLMSSLSIGAGYGLSRFEENEDTINLNSTLTTRIGSKTSLNLFASRDKSNQGQYNDTLYAFMTISFPESNNYFNASYDTTNDSKRVSWNKSNTDKINSFDARAGVSDDRDRISYDGEISYRSPIGDFTTFYQHNNNDDNTSDDVIRLNYAGSFLAVNKKLFVARPVDGAFAVIGPNKYLQGQRFGVRSTSEFNEGENIIGEAVVLPNLTPYYHRQINLDTSKLEAGYRIKNETIAVYPYYKTGHYIEIGEPGTVVLLGKLILDNKPLQLTTGTIENIRTEEVYSFFTGRRGTFSIEGLSSGSYEIIFDRRDLSPIKFEVNKGKSGVLNLGELKVRKN